MWLQGLSHFIVTFLNVLGHPSGQGLDHTSVHEARAVPCGHGHSRQRDAGGKQSSMSIHMAEVSKLYL